MRPEDRIEQNRAIETENTYGPKNEFHIDKAKIACGRVGSK